ncbi:MAG: DUF2853 family protein [Planctomycetota bacterium]
MSNFQEVIDKCKAQMEAQNIAIDEAFLEKVAKSLGPSIYNADSLVVATGDEGEMNTVKAFVTKKMGVEAGADMDAAIAAATEKIGKSNTKKLRPVYYYLLAKELGKEASFG